MITINADGTINIQTVNVDLQNFTAEQLADWFRGDWDLIRAVRTDLINECKWIIERHRDQRDAGDATTLSEDQFRQMLRYVQQLRDLPQTQSDPHALMWPIPPDLEK